MMIEYLSSHAWLAGVLATIAYSSSGLPFSRPALVVPAFDTVVHAVAARRGAARYGVRPRWFLEFLDALATACCVVGGWLLHVSNSVPWFRVAGVALLAASAGRASTTIHRFSCWRRLDRSAGMTDVANSLRNIVSLTGAGVVVVASLATILLTDDWGGAEHAGTAHAVSTARLLSGISDQQQARAAAAALSPSLGCARLVRVTHTAWPSSLDLSHSPAHASVLRWPPLVRPALTAVSFGAPGGASGEVVVDASACTIVASLARLVMASALTATAFGVFFMGRVFGYSLVTSKVQALLAGVVPLARNLEADGMVQTDVGVDGVPLLITAEEAVRRVCRCVTLMLRASFRGHAVMQRLLGEVRTSDPTEGVENAARSGLLGRYGADVAAMGVRGDDGGGDGGGANADGSGHGGGSGNGVNGGEDGGPASEGWHWRNRLSRHLRMPSDAGSVLSAAAASEAPAPSGKCALGSLGFDVLTMSRAELEDAVVKMFQGLGLLAPDDVRPSRLMRATAAREAHSERGSRSEVARSPSNSVTARYSELGAARFSDLSASRFSEVGGQPPSPCAAA